MNVPCALCPVPPASRRVEPLELASKHTFVHTPPRRDAGGTHCAGRFVTLARDMTTDVFRAVGSTTSLPSVVAETW